MTAAEWVPPRAHLRHAKPGDLYQHTETGEIAVFRDYRETITGEWLLVLGHPKWGECRWHPKRARRYTPEAKPTGSES